MNTGTKDTMPCHQWVSAAIDEAKVSVEDMERYATRRRMHIWFDAGETIAGATDMIRRFVSGGRAADRVDGEVGFLRRAIGAARSRS